MGGLFFPASLLSPKAPYSLSSLVANPDGSTSLQKMSPHIVCESSLLQGLLKKEGKPHATRSHRTTYTTTRRSWRNVLA